MGGRDPAAGPWLLAASLGLSLNVLARAELGGPLRHVGGDRCWRSASPCSCSARGTSPRRLRWLSWAGLAVVVLAAGALSAGFAYAAVQSRHDLAAGLTTAELGVAALENGEFDAAADWFAEAQPYLDAANVQLDEPWARAAAVVPVAAQHQRAVSDMSHAGADALRTVSDALDEIDLDELRPERRSLRPRRAGRASTRR